MQSQRPLTKRETDWLTWILFGRSVYQADHGFEPITMKELKMTSRLVDRLKKKGVNI